MPTSAHPTPHVLAALEPTVLPDGPVLVATDTTVASDAAIPLAAALCDMTRADPILLTVIPPSAVPMYGVDGIVVALDALDEDLEARAVAARAQLLRMRPGTTPWPVHVATGEPADQITRGARERSARLIVVGRGRHAGLDRVLGGESVLRMLQLGDTPVLAVQPTLTSPPRRVVIATDFSPFSVYAAQVALTIAAPDATVWLLHVGPPFDESVPYLQAHAAAYRDMATTAFSRMLDVLPIGRRTCHPVALTGSAPDALLTFLDEQHADLVVSATHGYGFLRRMMLGSVAATLIRRAPCSVLAVPGSARTIAEARARQRPNARTTSFSVDHFDRELAAFTTRNAGRRCTVEIDTHADGAQVLGHELMLAGATYDRHDGGVTVMFGTSVLRGMHLSHVIPGVTAIDLSRNGGGEDQTLRVAHAGGQTLLTLH